MEPSSYPSATMRSSVWQAMMAFKSGSSILTLPPTSQMRNLFLLWNRVGEL